MNARQTRIASTGLGIDPGCAANLEQLVRRGARQLDDTRAPPQLVDQAAANLERLIDVMAVVAQEQNATTLHEWSLEGAMARLCPLFPFC
jgi:hypothetical protein